MREICKGPGVYYNNITRVLSVLLLIDGFCYLIYWSTTKRVVGTVLYMTVEDKEHRLWSVD